MNDMCPCPCSSARSVTWRNGNSFVGVSAPCCRCFHRCLVFVFVVVGGVVVVVVVVLLLSLS